MQSVWVFLAMKFTSAADPRHTLHTYGQCEAALCTTSADCLAVISRIQCMHGAHTPGRPWKIYTLLLGQVLLHWYYKQDGPNGNWVLGFSLGFTRSETS